MIEKWRFEWPTWGFLAVTYLVWAIATTWAAVFFLPLGMVLVTLSAAQHSSLTHEALHGHPTRINWLNELLVFPALSLVVPYKRFRDTHLAHHRDETLTDPYDDPETNFLDPQVWHTKPEWLKVVLRFNNTLLGRLLIGPMIGQIVFMKRDWQEIKTGDWQILAGWLWHGVALCPVFWWVVVLGEMPLWAFFLGSYGALSILKIRTFLEHRAYEDAPGRCVLIEDRGPLALIFLNNNLHFVHHSHPNIAWYDLPARFAREREIFLSRNGGYYFRSYGEVFQRYFWRAKDPVPHPLFPRH